MGRRASNEPTRPKVTIGWFKVPDISQWHDDQLVLVDHPTWVRPIVQTAKYAKKHSRIANTA